ncbi:cation-transporting P-type ATPase [bacterium]|nr:cation-transporting P-type ATPase [bacterium]
MTAPYQRDTNEILDELGVRLDAGLARAEVERRRKEHGPNRLREAVRKSPWIILAAQFRSIIVYLLAGAAALSFSFGDWHEGAAIVAVLLINAAIGFFTELRAVRSMEALRKLSRVRARVRRDGKAREIAADQIVPGDIVLLEAGDVVPADLRLAETHNLQIDESALTGESVPVEKDTGALSGEAPIGDRANMAFKGTAITRGSAAGVTVATGMKTELGRIAALVESAEAEASPLEQRIDRLGGQLVGATLGITALVGVSGVAAGHEWLAMIKTAVALAVAAVPEGLPIVTTVALARGMWRMARRNALIEKLSAVETLGATTVILTDKTGTLTENRMTVVRLRLADADLRVEPGEKNRAAFFADDRPSEIEPGAPAHAAMRVAVLCNDARLPAPDEKRPVDAKPAGDPMEVALLAAGQAAGLEREALADESPRTREESFSPDTKMMATFHKTGDGHFVAVKGAPEAVIATCTRVRTNEGDKALDDAGRKEWIGINGELAAAGLRVLALASKTVDAEGAEPYRDLTLHGLVGLLDPPRADVADAIAACREAGVRVVMLTGDHAGTAKTVAEKVGLADGDITAIEASELADMERIDDAGRERILKANVFARVSPQTKLNLVTLFQKNGAVVAMTGDGVNDAPALKKADIGIAMGRRGTEVAREAAHMVLRDDAFASIVAAMAQGRVIFGNIRKFVLYLMSCNLSEILVIGVATLAGLPLPLLPLQILYLNLVTDVFPAFALGVGEGDPGAMRRPPRDPREPVLGRARWMTIGAYGALITAATLGAFAVALHSFGLKGEDAVTVSFLTLACAQLVHVFNMRDPGSGFFRNEVTRNPFVWGALALCAVLIAAAVYVPFLADVLGATRPTAKGWMLVAAGSAAVLVVGQVVQLLRPLWRKDR